MHLINQALLVVIVSQLNTSRSAETSLTASQAIQISFPSETAQSYQLQISPSGSATDWVDIGQLLSGTGGPLATFAVATNHTAIYRLKAFPNSGLRSLTDGLILFLPFAGSVTNTLSGYEHSVTVTEFYVNTFILAEDRFSRKTNAINLQLGRVTIANSPAFSAKDFSISLWIRPRSGFLNTPLMTKGKDNMALRIDPRGMVTFAPRVFPGLTMYWETAAGAIKGDTWQHLAAIYAPSLGKVRIFINSEELVLTGGTTVPPAPDNFDNLVIGFSSSYTHVDAVRIFDRAITELDIKALYLADN